MADEYNDLVGKIEPLILAKKKPFQDARKKIVAGDVQNYGDLTTYFDRKHEALKKVVVPTVKVSKVDEGCCQSITCPKTRKRFEEEAKKKKARELGFNDDVSYLKGKKGIPGFWERAIKNHKLITDEIKPLDQKVFKNIVHVET
jgi:hypothetical protein